MALFNCLHPITFTHSHTGETMTVPCGHCDFCLQSKYVQVLRLCDYENMFSKYSLFITLTYNRKNLPCVYFNGNEILDPRTGELIPFDFTLHPHAPKKIAVTYRYDVQTFLKRLRKHLSKYAKNEDQTFSFFYVSEYGTKRGRPHYHMLLYTDCEYLAKHAFTVLRKTWQNGFVYVKPAIGGAGQYITKYVGSGLRGNQSFSNPVKKIRQMYTFSQKSRFFGFGFIENEHSLLDEFIKPGVNKFVSRTDAGFRAERLWRTFEDYYFPQCYQFDRQFRSIFRLYFNRGLSEDAALYETAKDLADIYARYHNVVPTGDKKFDDFCKRQYQVFRRVCKLALRFNLTPQQYIFYILLYKKNKKKNQLVDYLYNLEEFSTTDDYRLQYLQFSQFASRLNKHVTTSLNLEYDEILHYLKDKKIEDIHEVHDRHEDLKKKLAKCKKTRRINDEKHNL